MKILIIHPETKTRELIEFTIESQLRAQTVCAASTADAIKVLQGKNDFKIIVADSGFSSQDQMALSQAVDRMAVSPAILFCDFTPTDAKPFSDLQAHLVDRVQKEILRMGPQMQFTNDNPEYCRVRASIALRTGLLKCDLYVKLKDDKYIKVFREGDLLDLLDLSRFENKKIEYFHIKTDNGKALLDRLSNEFKRLNDEDELSLESQIQISTTTLEMISDFSQSCGFNPQVEKLTQLSIKLAVKTIQKNPELNDLYAKIQVHPDRFLVSHSVLLAHVACGLASLLGWTSDDTFYKLSLAAFLHDITLDSDELAKVLDLSVLSADVSTFSSDEKRRFKEHPEKAASIAMRMSEIPPDVHTIIREHHEQPDGTGFPYGLKHSELSPLGSVFIMAENLIHFQTLICTTPDLSLYINSISPAYSKGVFKGMTEALIDSLIRNPH